jgi:hypothetical protein
MKNNSHDTCSNELSMRVIRCIVICLTIGAVAICGIRMKRHMAKKKAILVYKVSYEVHVTKPKHKYNECIEAMGKAGKDRFSSSDIQTTCSPLLKKKKDSSGKKSESKKEGSSTKSKDSKSKKQKDSSSK